ncbi:ChaC-domain-containing protein [Gonapodya prolifera JEL478]|uniref:glutathione-specific gamma-glutamylcyclotransferase n=1 Tax=Gonapodya prolifera (strain JEL478) TaxID=1344416 RepID=A0A139AG88_GONPJ|nr:ChaC-domain-containing protein [Gonapodya prolifera JEL478]|eukprot:KXS15842.1 ChaC-domain-containing protein [Gonapodya prolifera JEL478]
MGTPADSNDFWVFGYGSLIWKVDFPVEKQVTGYIKGYVRRFYQGSVDHRGTEDKPGRVVTLIPRKEYQQLRLLNREDPMDGDDDEDQVWGVAYKIPPEKAAETREHLDFREKNGYASDEVAVYGLVKGDNSSEPVEIVLVPRATLYVALPSNPSFLGPSSVNEMAYHVLTSHGPSGPNIDYLEGMVKHIRAKNMRDDHVEKLWSAVDSLRDVVRSRQVAIRHSISQGDQELSVVESKPTAPTEGGASIPRTANSNEVSEAQLDEWERKHRELGQRVKDSWKALGYLATGIPILKSEVADNVQRGPGTLIADENSSTAEVNDKPLFSAQKVVYRN